MKVLGLTGGIAAGKSTVSAILAAQGCTIIDADKIGHEVMEPGGRAYAGVVEAFGCLRADGTIDRPALGQIVFADEEARKRLNALTHPHIQAEMERRMQESDGIVVLDCALLIEAGFYKLAEVIWLVTASEEVRARRIMRRNNLSEEAALARIRSQMTDDEKRAYAHREIVNDGSERELRDRVVRELAALGRQWREI